MKHISILVPNNAILGSLEGSIQVLSQVNNLFRSKGLDPVFDVQLVGLSKETPVSGGIFIVNADVLITDVFKTDLIIIPAIDGDITESINSNKELLPWIVQQYNQGAEVASLCLGAFILASTGLLSGKKCAIHWLAEQDFKRMFPDITLVTKKIITDEHRIYSSGGAFSAKVFAIDLQRDS